MYVTDKKMGCSWGGPWQSHFERIQESDQIAIGRPPQWSDQWPFIERRPNSLINGPLGSK
jgi:hypothetical protein